MKMSVKKAVACTALAAAMTASAAVSAGAVDYASKPSYTPPASQSSSPVYSASGRSSMTAISKIAESDIADAITSSLKTKHDAVVYVSGANISLNADAVAAIANAEAPITFSAGKYSVTIDPSTVFDVKDINIAMALYVGEKSTNVNGVSVPAGSMVISPRQKGDFGMTMKVRIPSSQLKGIDLKKANLYFISENGVVTKVDDALTVNTNGSAVVSLTHGAMFVISDKDLLRQLPTENVEAFDGMLTNETTEIISSESSSADGIVLGAAALAAVSAAVLAVAAKKKRS